MKSWNVRTWKGRLAALTGTIAVVLPLLAGQPAQAAQRTFIVMLAHAPKSFETQPELTPFNLIDAQYFDTLDDDIGSFAEYWEEISYGDVTISGLTTDWFNLPWPIKPLEIEGETLTPETFVDLDQSGTHHYGAGEPFTDTFAQVIIDLDGDPFGRDNGPTFPGPGLTDTTAKGFPVWTPGERFIDMDEDGKWDGVDEANNSMDWDGDFVPDLLGPRIDLNEDRELNNPGNCIYLADSDNDGNPDCCPNGPGTVGCEPFASGGPRENLTGACPATQWEGPRNAEFVDCNGNLIPDACDISCSSPECVATRWLDDHPDLCGDSQDKLPLEPSGDQCDRETSDGIPDECQYHDVSTDCTSPGNLEDTDNPCQTLPGVACQTLADRGILTRATPRNRCEFDDSNGDSSLAIVEPYENFLRRWEPCDKDPDARDPESSHWVKVYDPNSTSSVVGCDGVRTYYAASTAYQPPFTCLPGSQDCDPANPTDPNPLYQRSYIQNNYPGDWKAVEERARGRTLWGSHDPDNLLPSEQCHCDIPCQTNSDCPGGSKALCDTQQNQCRCVNGPERPDGTPIAIPKPLGAPDSWQERACPAGFHPTYDPPDRWLDSTDEDTEEFLRSCKMQPTEFDVVANRTFEPPWYQQAWKDRYVGSPSHPLAGHSEPIVRAAFGGCENPDFDEAAYNPNAPPGPSNQPPRIECEPPAWDASGRIPLTVPLVDRHPDEPQRRFFSANAGGLNGDGTGWIGCDQALDGFVIFETSDLSTGGSVDLSFEALCNHPILPEEERGLNEPPIFYDGWVEHDDLPSSKYHKGGDERLGEITSPRRTFLWVRFFEMSHSLFTTDPGQDAVRIPAIWGRDIGDDNPNTPGGSPDTIIPAAGPYATNIHGNFGYDAGNVLSMELLTWRTKPPFDNGTVWESLHGPHPYAGPSGANLGFRDFNLDGLIDQGEVRQPASANYVVDSLDGTGNDGTHSWYPFNRRRLLEDCVEVLDAAIDFDDFVDAEAMYAATGCSGAFSTDAGAAGALTPYPIQYFRSEDDSITASGIASGIVLLPPGIEDVGEQLFPIAPSFYPIHTEDGLNDPQFIDANLPQVGNRQLSWHLFFHDLVKPLPRSAEGPVEGPADPPYDTPYAAHEYLHSWERLPDLYDYDVFEQDAKINCPIGGWDIMANGGLVHPVAPLKELGCTDWISSVDLRTVLTPGVEAEITLPPAELVRDNSYYFLPNENRPGELLYLWSAGSGFDAVDHPGGGGHGGAGVLILHTDFGANPDREPPQQRTPPFTYVIVQADGLGELEDGTVLDEDVAPVFGNTCVGVADAGDPWPGSTDNTEFNCNTNPPSRWYTQNSCTGLDITNIELVDGGAARVRMRWTPQNIPSLEFVDPPGGVSVPAGPGVERYPIRFKATDVYGGTTVRMYYISAACWDLNNNGQEDIASEDKNGDGVADVNDCPVDPADATLIGETFKGAPGTINMSMNWNIVGVPDGRYHLFAELLPGPGADGTEIAFTEPIPGRTNDGRGEITNIQVNPNGGRHARTETWTLELVDIESDGTQDWLVNATLSQPRSEDPEVDPFPHLFVDPATRRGTYVSPGGEVSFTLRNTGTTFAIGDRWSFVTTGLTQVSRAVTIDEGEIDEAPNAIIKASPIAGPPPLSVDFDGRESMDPNGTALEFRWRFGDGSATQPGATARHVFTQPGTFTVVLRATSVVTGLFDENSVDILVTNNSPRARIGASPTSGPAPLTVNFTAASSSDSETAQDDLIYQWDFGDGSTANDSGTPGEFIQTQHFYSRRVNGTECTNADPCTFLAKLTVTDEGGKSSIATTEIQVGNSNPIAKITASSLQGPAPWTVTFNAKNSVDPDGDPLTVDWEWGDGEADLGLPVTGPAGRTDGQVEHTYDAVGSYKPVVTIRDGRGGKAVWSAVTVVVNEATVGDSDPRAIFTLDPEEPVVGEAVTADASLSFDRPAGSVIADYRWDWGDGSDNSAGITATHAYTQSGTYKITLTVFDGETPPNSNSTTKTVVVTDERPPPDSGGGDENRAPNASFDIVGGVNNLPQGIAGVTEFTFDASSSSDADGDPLTYQWDMGDGTLQSGSVVTYTYDESGSYLVQLTVQDGKAADFSRRTVTITSESDNRIPVAVLISTSPLRGSVPLTVSFDGSNSFDVDGDTLSYRWLLEDGTEIGTGSTLNYTFDQTGTFTVILEVSDGVAVGRSTGAVVDVLASSAPPEPPPGQDTDGEEPTPGTGSGRRGTTLCGLGMLTSLLGSVVGLFLLAASRRRFRLF